MVGSNFQDDDFFGVAKELRYHTVNMLRNLEHVGTIWLILEWSIRIGALFVVPRNRKPTSATSWLLFIFIFPFAGLLFFLLLGSPKLPKSRRNAQKTLDGFIKTTLKQIKAKRDTNNLLSAKAPVKYGALAALSESLGHMPVFSGNDVEVLAEYDDAINRLAADINKAKYFVHLEFFIFVLDDVSEPVFAAMANAVKRGVKVRVMYDAISTRPYPGFKKMRARLLGDGVIVRSILPFKLGRDYVRPDLRNHRKLVVIDGDLGYTEKIIILKIGPDHTSSLYK